MNRESFADVTGEDLIRKHVQSREKILVRARIAARKSPRSARSAAVLELHTLDSIAEVQGIKKAHATVTPQHVEQLLTKIHEVVEKYVDPAKREALKRELREAKWQVLRNEDEKRQQIANG